MIAINLTVIKVSLEKIKARKDLIAKKADGQFRQKLYWLAQQAILVSPQFSGDFASNWNLAIDGNMPVYRPLPGKYEYEIKSRGKDHNTKYYSWKEAHKAGDPEAVGLALSRIAGYLAHVTIKSRVHLVNATELETDGTHMTGPDGVVKLRPENIIPGQVRIESYVRSRAQEMR